MARSLAKSYGTIRALSNFSFSVSRGEILGLLGPNGAGKTTTMRIATGLVQPDHGSVELHGSLGALVGEPALYPWLTGRDNLRVLADAGPPVSEVRMTGVLAQVGLSRSADRKVKGYSHGMRQRLGIAAALLREPEILFLDEPTSGLDPRAMHELRDLFREVSHRGTAIVLSSHMLGEVERLCDRVCVLHEGSLVAEGTVAELEERHATVVVEVRAGDEGAAAAALAPLAATSTARGHFVVRGHSSDQVRERLGAQGISVRSMTVERADLESIYLELTREAPSRAAD